MPKAPGQKYSKIIISHPGTDFDSIASMWAAHILNPDVPVVMIAGSDSNVREFLALYGSEFKRIKLKEIDIGAVRHLILVDCASRSQLKRIEGLLDRKDVFVEVWDHHRKEGPEFKVDDLHYRKVGANTTVLVDEIIRKGIQLSPEEATLLLLGIYEDTGSLRFGSTTADDMIAASHLLKSGASLDTVDKFMGIRLTRAQKELLTTLSLNVRVIEVRGLPIHITRANVTEFVDEVAFLAKKVQETEAADVLFALIQLHERVFIVGRSRLPSVNVGQILSIFGGGGHPQAASCLLIGTTHTVAAQRLLDAIREQVHPSVLARDIMSTVVRTIDPESSIEDAHAIIVHTGYSGLVVTGDGYKVEGIITRPDIDKAMHHGLGHAPVKGYMIRNPVTISEESNLREIQNTIIEKRAGFLPVVFGGKVSGVVTRTDVLRALHKASPDTDSDGAGDLGELGKELLKKLPQQHLDLLALAGEVADSMRVSCYLVGGIVRDLMLDYPNADIDLMIEGDGIEFAHLLSRKLDSRVIENQRFRTAKILIRGGVPIDVATAREEFYLKPGALPEVSAAGIRDDLVRRDFTINTLAITLNTRGWGTMVDHFGGVDDIRNGLIRVLHTFSFFDDPTRILRALKFSERYKFELEIQTNELLKRALAEGRLDDISPERFRDEFVLCLKEDDAWSVARRISEEGILGIMHMPLYPPVSLREPGDLLREAIDWISIHVEPDDMPERDLFYMAYLIRDSEPREASEFIRKYKFDRSYRHLADALGAFQEARQVLHEPIDKASRLSIVIENLPIPYWADLIAGKDKDSPERRNMERFFGELMGVQPEVNGEDLIEEGFEPGPSFRKALDEIRRAKMDGEISTREEELEIARSILSQS